MPHGDDRQTMMFSATFPANIQHLAGDFMGDYIFLIVGRKRSASENVTQTVECVEQNHKLEHLMRFLVTMQDGLILVFVETKRICDYVEDVLCERGFPACTIHRDKTQCEHEDALKSFNRQGCGGDRRPVTDWKKSCRWREDLSLALVPYRISNL
ncbi:hypothetical protein ACHAWF_000824 [Thalassiosira exigua]